MDEGCEALVAQLAAPYRASTAYRTLLGRGFDALPAVRDGLRHESADVRLHCCRFLDHFLTPEGLEDLIAMLSDPDHRVRCSVLHTLACDRCKEGSCRPDKARVLPGALAILDGDPHPHARAVAVEVAGRWVHADPGAEDALRRAAQADPSRAVRKKAGWYAPGGAVHRRTKPKRRAPA